jgi:hypothetical protein
MRLKKSFSSGIETIVLNPRVLRCNPRRINKDISIKMDSLESWPMPLVMSATSRKLVELDIRPLTVE